MIWIVCILVLLLAAAILYYPHEIEKVSIVLHRRRKVNPRKQIAGFTVVWLVYDHYRLRHIFIGDAMTPIDLTTQEQTTGTVVFLNASQQPLPAPAGVVPTWEIDHPELASLTPSGDGLSALLVGVASGTVTVTVTAVVNGQTFTATQQFIVADNVVASIAVNWATPVAKS